MKKILIIASLLMGSTSFADVDVTGCVGYDGRPDHKNIGILVSTLEEHKDYKRIGYYTEPYSNVDEVSFTKFSSDSCSEITIDEANQVYCGKKQIGTAKVEIGERKRPDVGNASLVYPLEFSIEESEYAITGGCDSEIKFELK